VLIFGCRYGRAEFWDDLKKVYQMCGVDEREVAFLLTDSQVVNEVFLEDISNILNSGEVPGDKPRSQKQRLYICGHAYSCASSISRLAYSHIVIPGWSALVIAVTRF